MPRAESELNLPSAQSPPAGDTAWSWILLAIGAGILAAVQVGKAHIALPSIRASFSLSLVDASWILSALSFVGLLVATPVGSLAAKIGNKRTIAFGLLIIALASAAGAFAPSAKWLIVLRIIEGLGVVMVVVAAPSLIVEVTQNRNIRIALAGWAAYVPAGVALITLLAPFVLTHHTWRAVWIIDAVVLAVYALLIIAKPSPKQESRGKSPIVRPWQELKAVFTARGPVLLSVIFAMYTFQHLGIMGLMPTVLMENYGVSPNSAGVLVSSAMAANILGNLAAGVLLQRGVRRSVLIGSTSIFMALMTIGMFSAHLPLAPAYVCCFLFSCVGGIVPGSVISAAPFYSPSESLIPATNGLLVQGSNLGIVLGPPLISSMAAHAGWAWVPALTLIAAIVATILALIVNRNVQPALGKALQGS